MAVFVPTDPPLDGTPADVATWGYREFIRQQQLYESRHDLDVLHAEPDKVEEGMVRYADGTDWDPGWGKGPYVYDGTSWVYMAWTTADSYEP